MIRLEGISKTYRIAQRTAGLRQAVKSLFHREMKEVQALQEVSFAIDEGEIVGYIGPNGAGKSTTIKVMCGILVPDRGQCSIMGYTPWQERASYVRGIGVVFGQRTQLWWDVPVADSFGLLRDIYKVPTNEYNRNLERLTDSLDLAPLLQTPVRQLSLGQRMRCELAASLLHSPKVLFLDESTIGLDAVSKQAVREFIRSINREKSVTVILTTHDMDDIEALAGRIMMIGKGRLLYDGSLQHLRSRFGSRKTITADYTGPAAPLPIAGAELVSTESGKIVLSVDTEQSRISDVLAQLSAQVQLDDISIHTQPIEDMILQLYKEHRIS